jgi:hypothetical protein
MKDLFPISDVKSYVRNNIWRNQGQINKEKEIKITYLSIYKHMNATRD